MRVSSWRALVHPLVVLSARRPLIPAVVLGAALVTGAVACQSGAESAAEAPAGALVPTPHRP